MIKVSTPADLVFNANLEEVIPPSPTSIYNPEAAPVLGLIKETKLFESTDLLTSKV